MLPILLYVANTTACCQYYCMLPILLYVANTTVCCQYYCMLPTHAGCRQHITGFSISFVEHDHKKQANDDFQRQPNPTIIGFRNHSNSAAQSLLFRANPIQSNPIQSNPIIDLHSQPNPINAPGIIWLQVIRDGVPQLVSIVPCVLVLLGCTYYCTRVFISIEMLLLAHLVTIFIEG